LQPSRTDEITDGEVRERRQSCFPTGRQYCRQSQKHIRAALSLLIDCVFALFDPHHLCVRVQLKWVIQMSTTEKQDFTGEWTSGVKQVLSIP